MKRSRFSEEQIIGSLKEYQAVLSPAELCLKHGVSEPTFYSWRSKYGGMEVSDAKRLKALEEENAKLKKLLSVFTLDVSTLREMLGELGHWREGLFPEARLRARRDRPASRPLSLDAGRRRGIATNCA